MAGSNSEVGRKQLLHEVVMCDKLNAGFWKTLQQWVHSGEPAVVHVLLKESRTYMPNS